MRDCPKCSKPVDGTRCGFCGFSEDITDSGDPLRHTCAHLYLGQRCSRYGTLTENRQGGNGKEPHPGPWYCADHFPTFGDMFHGERTPPPQGFKSLKDLVNYRLRDVEAEDERIAIEKE